MKRSDLVAPQSRIIAESLSVEPIHIRMLPERMRSKLPAVSTATPSGNMGLICDSGTSPLASRAATPFAPPMSATVRTSRLFTCSDPEAFMVSQVIVPLAFREAQPTDVVADSESQIIPAPTDRLEVTPSDC